MKTIIAYDRALEVLNSNVVDVIQNVRRALKRDEKLYVNHPYPRAIADSVSFEPAQLDSSYSVIFWFIQYGPSSEPQKRYLFELPKTRKPKGQIPTNFTDLDGNIVGVGDRVFYTGTAYGNSRAALESGNVVRFTEKSVVIKSVKSGTQITREFRFVVKAPHKQ